MAVRLLGTVEIAKLVGLHQTTIINWIDDGKLTSFKTLGGHRKVTAEELVAFLRRNGMPVPAELRKLASGKRIVIVDDEAAVLKILARRLAKADATYEIRTFTSSVDALLEIGSANPDLIIVDIFIPDMDGYQLCRQIRANPRTNSMAIIAISGQPAPETGKKARAAGADDFYAKTDDFAELLQKIQKVLRLQERRASETRELCAPLGW